MHSMRLTLEFGGGLELLFDSVKKHEVELASDDKSAKEITVESLLVWIRDNLLKERPEMFIRDNSVRPGILVLINDCDWELCGNLHAPLEDKDTVVFISTLHAESVVFLTRDIGLLALHPVSMACKGLLLSQSELHCKIGRTAGKSCPVKKCGGLSSSSTIGFNKQGMQVQLLCLGYACKELSDQVGSEHRGKMAAKLRAVMCWTVLIAMVLSSLLLQAPLVLRNSQVSNAACVCNSGAANGEAHFIEEQKPQAKPQQQHFQAHGTAHYGFVQFSAYRQSPRTFFIVGITSVAVRDYTPPVQECEWKSSSSSGGGGNNSSSPTATAAAEMIYIGFDENGALFVPAIINCSFPDPVGGDGLGGELSITLPAGARGGKTVTVLAMAEERGAAARFFHSQPEPAPRLPYAFCGPPMHSEVRAEWILHWLVYHHALWRQQAHFFLYNVGGLKPQQRRLFLPYIRAGVLTITEVAREADFPSWYYQQPLLANDCLHRSRFLADWTFFQDFDEFLHVPAPATLPSLLLLHRQAPWISFGSLPVSHSHCLDAGPDLWPLERMRWRHSAPECMHADRDPWTCVAAPGRRKYAVNPRAVFAAGVHRSALPEHGGVDLNASVARIHHYHGVLAPQVELCHHQVNLSHSPEHLDWLMPGFANYVHDSELAALVSAARRAWLSSIPGPS